MKWWSTLSSSIPHSNGYESVENKDKGEIRIELKQCSIFGEDNAKHHNGIQANILKQLEKGLSVDEEVSLAALFKCYIPTKLLNIQDTEMTPVLIL
jgi:hypothetical protein